ncbi:DMT family transporter [Ramlibacter alkalitolerans]|uniref:DMT family transporter n=1 Tax=Ramlibacter alkalitolerans TaxID=2039631 RepID=A0ABS1JM96_9BURK|nr:DMT family transporter [Ramlibacter alkalitolerans]MBL0425372.1 DMT family transporter [Ramlibacter alkalitolerans]
MQSSPPADSRRSARRHLFARHALVAQRRIERLPGNVRALLWSTTAGLLFVVLNSLMRGLSLAVDPFQTQFLRYLMGFAVMLPLMLRAGVATYWPKNVVGQFTRGGVHTIGLVLWFIALPHITIADVTAIGFTGPIFIMLGAVLVFKESMRWERWLAAGIGLAGVLIVVAPKLTGGGGVYNLVMLASSPVFAASFLMTKALTRYERPGVIVAWQSISVTVLSLPLALWHWQWPGPGQWLLFLLCGLLGSSAHYCLTRSYAAADISATQSVKFLELVWATLIGWLWFDDQPSRSTLIGGLVISASTLWIARREARGPR